MSKELKPCPFCGGAASIQNGPSYIWYAECGNCGVGGKIKHDEKEAITAWNRRASQAQEGFAVTSDGKTSICQSTINGSRPMCSHEGSCEEFQAQIAAAPAGGETGEG